ncbi:transmembrane protein 6/97 [Phascolomyces articulosus]|uniref:Efficient mitochondria targeting-associated protein 19 n=1 Tax=Phascolomyces articulosus TaxID=60185 RepID=A0AAD5KMK2_9FUNG|nr:transmembrane protein 6/97 [Phascolomyces articulosus]
MATDQKACHKCLFSRPLDLVYFIYFLTHIPITLCIDLQGFYPADQIPQVLKDAVAFYVNTYKDPFMGATTPIHWFEGVTLCELFLQLPFFFVALYGLYNDSIHVRVGLMVYASHVATTMVPIFAELFFNPGFGLSESEIWTLFGFYVPYLIIPLTILIDSYIRVSKAISGASAHIKTE